MSVVNKLFIIANEFSKTPGPRFRDEGRYSGEELREEYLVPLVKSVVQQKSKIIVDLDGTHGYLTSFLEEAFGGLIRVDKFNLRELNQIFEFKSDEEPYLIDDIKEYMEDAQNESR